MRRGPETFHRSRRIGHFRASAGDGHSLHDRCGDERADDESDGNEDERGELLDAVVEVLAVGPMRILGARAAVMAVSHQEQSTTRSSTCFDPWPPSVPQPWTSIRMP